MAQSRQSARLSLQSSALAPLTRKLVLPSPFGSKGLGNRLACGRGGVGSQKCGRRERHSGTLGIIPQHKMIMVSTFILSRLSVQEVLNFYSCRWTDVQILCRHIWPLINLSLKCCRHDGLWRHDEDLGPHSGKFIQYLWSEFALGNAEKDPFSSITIEKHTVFLTFSGDCINSSDRRIVDIF